MIKRIVVQSFLMLMVCLANAQIVISLDSVEMRVSDPSNNNSSQSFNLDTLKLKSADTFYQCSMDAEVISDKSGQCPKCGMELSEIIKK